MTEAFTGRPTEAPAVVVGGGVGGLNAAFRLAQLGLSPTLLEARGGVGGLVFSAPIGGIRVDLGAESFAKRSRYTADLCRELGLEVVDPAGGSWIWADGRAGRIPHGVLGIPVDLDDPGLTDLLTPDGLARARDDLTLPVTETPDDLAGLVETRLGREVLDRLVEPVAGGVHSAPCSQLAADVVAPGLSDALRREGSLVRAAAALRAGAPAGAVVSSVSGGLFRLAGALRDRIVEVGGSVLTRRIVTAITRDGDGWLVTHHGVRPGPNPAAPPEPDGEPVVLRAPRLIVALDGRAALDLMRPLDELGIGDWTLPRGADLVQVCLAIDDPRLDAAPRGSGLLVAPPTPTDATPMTAKALTHYSHKWGWVRDDQPVHVLRVSYGRAGVPTPEPTLAAALRDASVLLGVDLSEDAVRGHAVIHFDNSLPPQTPAHRVRVAALDAAVAALPGLGVTGAWFAGTGLAAVLPHAEDVARRLA